MSLEQWLPVIISGIFVAFGAALWLWVRSMIKGVGDKLDVWFSKADVQSEKYLGKANSNEMWETIATFGDEIAAHAREMIKKESFQPVSGLAQPAITGESITNVSNIVSEQVGAKRPRVGKDKV